MPDVFIPAGAIMPFGGPSTKIPKGWMLCDGTLLDKNNAEYQNLFNAIGVSWGGDGADKFALPDLRGHFLRGVSDNSGIDPEANIRDKSRPELNSSGNGGNAVGSKQKSQTGPHTHEVTNLGFRHDNLAGGRRGWGGAEFTQYDAGQGLKDIKSLMRVENASGVETRPVNAYVHYMIKL